MAEHASASVRHVPVVAVCGVFLAYVIVMGAGALLWETGHLAVRQFDLDAEHTGFTWVSGVMLWLGGAAIAAAVRTRFLGRSALMIAVLLTFMGTDEALVIHERLESRFGVDWQVLYAPLVLLAGIATIPLLRTLVRAGIWSAACFAAGGAAWAIAEVLEQLQWTPDDEKGSHYVSMMLTEEMLEPIGSFLFVLAIVLLVRGAWFVGEPHATTPDGQATPPAVRSSSGRSCR